MATASCMSGQTFSCWFEFLSFAVIQRGLFFTPFSWWNLNLMSSNTIQVCCSWQIHQSGILYPMTATSHKLGYISTRWAWLNPNFHLSNFIGWTQHPNIFHGFPCFNLYFHHLKTLVFVPFFMFFSWFSMFSIQSRRTQQTMTMPRWGHRWSWAGPMACADSFDQLAIPPVGADPYDGTMRHAPRGEEGRRRNDDGTMMERWFSGILIPEI